MRITSPTIAKCDKAATNAFEKDFFKLKNNCIYGKSVQNPYKKVNFRLATQEEKMLDLCARPDLTRISIFSQDLMGFRLKKTNVRQDKPSFIGQTVLDISKLIMYKFRYETLVKIQNDLKGSLYLSAGDTDSFFIHLKGITNDAFLDRLDGEGLLDSSNYDLLHYRHSNFNKAKLGCWKDEAAGRKFKAWYFLRPKMYELVFEDEENVRKAKGIGKNSLSSDPQLYSKLARMEATNSVFVNEVRIRSSLHSVCTSNFRKRALCAYEDKRLWVSPNLSYPYS